MLYVGPLADAQVWRVTPIANTPYFFLLEGNNDLLIDVPGGSHADNLEIQVFRRTEHANQQWVFLPVLADLQRDAGAQQPAAHENASRIARAGVQLRVEWETGLSGNSRVGAHRSCVCER